MGYNRAQNVLEPVHLPKYSSTHSYKNTVTEMKNYVCSPGHAFFTHIVLETLGCWHNLDYWHSDEQ